MRMNLFSSIVTECSDGSVVFRFGDESEKAAIDEINNSRVDVEVVQISELGEGLLRQSNVHDSEIHASPASAADTEGTAVVSLHS